MDILQEECGELIVAISKVRRFGLDNSYKEGGTQREHFTDSDLEEAKQRKETKLKVWSKIYE